MCGETMDHKKSLIVDSLIVTAFLIFYAVICAMTIHLLRHAQLIS